MYNTVLCFVLYSKVTYYSYGKTQQVTNFTLTAKPFGPGRPIGPTEPRFPVEPAGPGFPSSPDKPCKDRKNVTLYIIHAVLLVW